MARYLQNRSENDRLAWPILLLLLTVLVPSLGVVWMMREAVRNERLATSQRLREAYRAQLHSARQTVVDRWTSQLDELASKANDQPADAVFAQAIVQSNCDSALICDRSGTVVYPDPPNSVRPAEPTSPAWQHAQDLEFTSNEPAAAAAAYATLAGDEPDAAQQARARQAQARSLIKAGDTEAAIDVLRRQRESSDLHDYRGRSFAIAAELRLLEITDRSSPLWREVAQHLSNRLGEYGSGLSSSQRRFAMAALDRLAPGEFAWPTQAAETLAAEVATVWDTTRATSHLQPTLLKGVWGQSSSDGRVVGLWRHEKLYEQILKLAADLPLPAGVQFAVFSPDEEPQHLLDVSLGDALGDWKLGLVATDGDPFGQTSRQRNAVHAWIACLVLAITCVLAWLLATTLRRHVHLARLKNDLVATVSHELKTPLASIRLLIDTLLEADGAPINGRPESQQREYLELISHENARLTRLIDNFLTFSRIDRGRQRFDFQTIDARDVLTQSADVFREHWSDSAACLQMNAPQHALLVSADVDSLVMAVSNLLENAWKYSEEPKRIVLAASDHGDTVAIAIRDNGIGLSPRAARKVFDRFYQVDQRVARTHGGCGLGLSIVRAIAQAHGGRVTVDSQPGEGSTFTLHLPKHTDTATRGSEQRKESSV